ncbi:MAG: TIGR03032 family protein [Chromatiales bacterium]|nr:TIGR03032 family protein [Chromatiales bacterium]
MNSVAEQIDTDREPDFSCMASVGLAALLKTLGISLMLTSYQANRVILVRSDGEELHVGLKKFPRPMGLATHAERVVLGIHAQIVDFRRFDQVNEDLEPAGRVDACFVPRATHITGMINVHDIAWGDEGLWVVNSAFSCLALIRPDHSFVPVWKPPFITELVAQDRCHLNGMAMRNGRPRYVSMFSNLNDASAWRKEQRPLGQIMDVETGEVLVTGLLMPHSPRYWRGKLYYCNSGLGELRRFDPQTRSDEVVLRVPGFTRGMAFHGPLLFLGSSRSRPSSASAKLPLNEEYAETVAGMYVVDLDTMEVIERIEFTGDVHQIYDIGVLPGMCFPELLNIDDELVSSVFDFPSLPTSPARARE